MTGAAAQITSDGGAVQVNGTGGGSGTSGSDYGVVVYGQGVITGGGTGNVTVNGTGGTATGNVNFGVYVTDMGSQITSGEATSPF